MHGYHGSLKILWAMSSIVLLGLSLVVTLALSINGYSLFSSTPEGLPRVQAINYRETGDLSRLQQRGKLRILLLNETASSDYLPNDGSMLDFELRTASDFATTLGLEPLIVYVKHAEDLVPALTNGSGDLIASNLGISSDLKRDLSFTVPLMHVRQVVLTRQDDETLSKPKDLSGRILGVRKNSPYWATAQSLLEQHEGLRFHVLPADISDQRKFDLLASGKIDVTLHDDWAFELAQHMHDQLRVAFPVTRTQSIAWGVRQDATGLKEQLDRYLNQHQLEWQNKLVYKDDFDGILERKVLRVVTRNNAASYYLWRGELMGFEYELAKEFARKHKLRLEVIVAPEWDEIIPMLVNGQADIAAAFLTPTVSRRLQGADFSKPYSKAFEVVVSRAGDEVKGPEDLAGRTFHVRRSSSYWQSLTALKDLYGFDIDIVPEDEETEMIIAQVASDDYDLTLADSNILDIELTWRDDVKAAFSLGDPIEHSWAVRNHNPKLLKLVNSFIGKQKQSTFYNNTYKKYFKSTQRIVQRQSERMKTGNPGLFTDYDTLVKQQAAIHGFDWRLLIAQMYQESRFQPTAISWAGAQGLMQVLPKTAQQMGFNGDLLQPETSILAGIKYMAWMRERFEPELPVQDRMWFTLAGYNAGAGHVRDARKLAKQRGLNPNRWFGNVEKAMLLLSKSYYARKAAHGYVRGREPVAYVRQIKNRYEAYLRLTESNLRTSIRIQQAPDS